MVKFDLMKKNVEVEDPLLALFAGNIEDSFLSTSLPTYFIPLQSIAMPPQDLSSRLKSLSESHRDTVRLIQRLSNFSPATASAEDNETRLELGAKIHQSLKDQEEELELLRQGTEDLFSVDTWSSTRRKDSEKNKDRVALVTQVDRLAEDLKLYSNPLPYPAK